MPAKRRRPTYANSVFVNCPFDAEYVPLFRALVFAIEFCGFQTRCALEADDSGETRAAKLLRVIGESRYGIHDISRTESNADGLPRFNMPYEFGLFVGFKAGGVAKQARKALLVLDREPYRYQKFLSDIAGQDIRHHGNEPDSLIASVRAWLQNQLGATRELPGGVYIVERYAEFRTDTHKLLRELRKSAAELDNFFDFHTLVFKWVGAREEAAGWGVFGTTPSATNRAWTASKPRTHRAGADRLRRPHRSRHKPVEERGTRPTAQSVPIVGPRRIARVVPPSSNSRIARLADVDDAGVAPTAPPENPP